jgi:hypothetical protein
MLERDSPVDQAWGAFQFKLPIMIVPFTKKLLGGSHLTRPAV